MKNLEAEDSKNKNLIACIIVMVSVYVRLLNKKPISINAYGFCFFITPLSLKC